MDDCNTIDDYVSLIESLKRIIVNKDLELEELSLKINSLNGALSVETDRTQEWIDKANHFKSLYKDVVDNIGYKQ